MGQHLVTHDPCDPSDFRDPFDPCSIDPFPALFGRTRLPLPSEPSIPVSTCQSTCNGLITRIRISSATTVRPYSITDCAVNTTSDHWWSCFRSDNSARVEQSAIHCNCRHLTRVLQKTHENLVVQSLLGLLLIMYCVLEAIDTLIFTSNHNKSAQSNLGTGRVAAGCS